MKILCIGDVHFADRPPSSCTESYLDDLFDILHHANLLAQTNGCAATVFAGDIIHLKAPNRTSHRLVQRIIDCFGSWSTPVYIAAGNHDMQNDRFESLFDTQPLGVIYRSGAARVLSGWSHKPTWEGSKLAGFGSSDLILPVYGVPWLQDWANPAEDVRDQSVREALEELRKESDGSAPILLVTHAPFYPPGLELPFENYPTGLFADMLPQNTSVYYGHIHEAHNTYISNDVRFCNAGAITRGSLHEYNLSRGIQSAIWDSITGQFEIVSLPHKPASEVFRLQEVAEAKSVQMELDEFLKSVGQASIEITSIESVLEHVRGLNLPLDVVRVIEDLFERASVGSV